MTLSPEHPLVPDYVAKSCRTWSEWWTAWDETPYLLARLGLLHGIFSEIRQADATDHDQSAPYHRIGFLLRLADTWTEPVTLPNGDRTRIIRKAIEMLAYNFFQEPEHAKGWPLTWNVAVRDQLMVDDLAWWFRPDPDNSDSLTKVCNLPGQDATDRLSKIVRSFGKQLAEVAWNTHHFTYSNLADARLNFLPLLLACGSGDLLLRRETDLTEEERLRLRKMALDRRWTTFWPVSVDPLPPFSCLEEALDFGSPAARVLLQLNALTAYWPPR